MHRVASIDFASSAAGPQLSLEVDGRSRGVPLANAGLEPLDDDVAAGFHRAARCSVGLDYFSWWATFHDALRREFDGRVGAVERAAVCLEYAMLLRSIAERGLSLAEYLRSGRHGIDPGVAAAGLRGRAVSEFLSGDGCGYVPTCVLPDLAAAGFNSAVGNGARRFLLPLSGDPVLDLSKLKSLAAGLDDQQVRCHWVLHGQGKYRDVAALRELWQGVESIRNGNGRQPVIGVVIDPFEEPVATSDATLAGFVEWPQRPTVLAGASARSWDGLRRTMEIGYRGLFVTPDQGPVDLILRACMIQSRQRREPVAQWTIEFADNTFPPGEFQQIQHELIALLLTE